jgi:hypothetical protein
VQLSQVEAMTRDALALFLDVPARSFEVVVVPDLRGADAALLDQARSERSQAEALQRSAVGKARKLAVRLHNRGLPLRDIGALLGVSFQRAQQLIVEEAEATHRRPLR